MVATGLGRWLYYANLVQALATRDIVARFKGSSLGLAWLVLKPTLFMLVFSVVRGIFRVPTDGVPYPLYSFVAITAWFLFTGTMQSATPSIQSNAGILKKIAVPRLLFPISAALVAIVEYAVTWLPLSFLVVFYHWPLHWTLIYAPLLVLIVVAFGLGLGLLTASMAVFRDDITLAMPHVITLWFFLTPVIWARLPPDYRWLYKFNPMTGPIEAFRDVVLHGTPPDWSMLVAIGIGLVVTWAAALPVYGFMSRYFADAL